MTIELSRSTFRRLVWAHLAAFVVAIPITGVELLGGRWAAFSADFDMLVARHFGVSDMSDAMTIAAGVVLVLFLAWSVVSTFGLLWFRRWARFGAWASVGATLAVLAAIEGYRPRQSSPLADLLTLVDGAVLGAILLLAYGRGLGVAWFAASHEPKVD